jgi:CMP-N,N'-diacetyllegionaminic acid synthase
MSRICTICARGGSKGVKNKNIRDLAGKPLIAYTLEQAQASGLFDVIAVSSDSAEILQAGRKYGAEYLVERPADLATDTVGKLPVIRHCVEEIERITGEQFDVVVDLDATSPLRLVEDISGVLDLLQSGKTANVITAAPAHRSPYFNMVELGESGTVRLSKPQDNPILRRQDSPKCFDMNASIYAWRRAALFDYPTIFNADTRLFVMPEERSIDIDTELDFGIVEFLMKKRNNS